MAGKGGARPGAGRKKGSPNKMTAQLKDMILGALDQAGGVDYLTKQASQNPSAFMTLVGKVLPMQVQGDKDSPLQVVTRVVLEAGRGNGDG